MLPSETTIPATVTVLAKRVARPVGQANQRILTVSLGDHHWDLYVHENEFEDAMNAALGKPNIEQVRAAESGD